MKYGYILNSSVKLKMISEIKWNSALSMITFSYFRNARIIVSLPPDIWWIRGGKNQEAHNSQEINSKDVYVVLYKTFGQVILYRILSNLDSNCPWPT